MLSSVNANILLRAIYMSLANRAELCCENLPSTQKDHLNELYALPTVKLRGCLYGRGPALLVGLALFAEIPRLS